MKTRLFILGLGLFTLTGFVTPAHAQSSYSADASSKPPTSWNTDPKYWEKVLREPKEFPDVKIGKCDYTISGPLVDGLRRRKLTGNPSLGKRLLNLPVVRLFVPQPMPSPPGGGRYFLRGESSRPWTAVAEGALASDPSNPVTREARSLISIGR